MKQGIIIVNAYAPRTDTRQVTRLSDEFSARGVGIDVVRNSLSASIENGNIAGLPDRYDFCIYLDKDKYISRMLEKSGLRVFNSASAIELCDDKMATHIALAGHGIPMPKTLPGLLCYDDSPLDTNYIDGVERALGYPVIVKAAFGSMGKSVYKADDRYELEKIARCLKNTPHLFQQYISSSHGKDMRVIVTDGHVLGGIVRSSVNGDFRSNVGLGGTAVKTDVPLFTQKIAIKAAEVLGLDYCGIDFLLGETPMLCEVNSNAFFDAFEEATGINVAGSYADAVIRKIYKV